MATAVFVISALCWRQGWVGGADVKLIGAASLSIAPSSIPVFMAAVAIAGGGLAAVYLMLRQVLPRPAQGKPRSGLARALRAEQWRIRRGGPLPYACAIACGFLFITL
jgi:prepilin peptidase CpaA